MDERLLYQRTIQDKTKCENLGPCEDLKEFEILEKDQQNSQNLGLQTDSREIECQLNGIAIN